MATPSFVYCVIDVMHLSSYMDIVNIEWDDVKRSYLDHQTIKLKTCNIPVTILMLT